MRIEQAQCCSKRNAAVHLTRQTDSIDRVSLGALWRRRSARQWRLHRQSRMQQSWQSFVPASSSRCCLPLLQVSALSDSAETSLHKLAGLSYH